VWIAFNWLLMTRWRNIVFHEWKTRPWFAGTACLCVLLFVLLKTGTRQAAQSKTDNDNCHNIFTHKSKTSRSYILSEETNELNITDLFMSSRYSCAHLTNLEWTLLDFVF
jgi:hypothetical protein